MAKQLKDKKLQILITQKQYDKLKTYADYKQVSMGDVLRRYIDRLPDIES